MLPDTDRKIVKLDSVFSKDLFAKMLRKLRESKKLSREFVGQHLEKDKKQIERYEMGIHFPPIPDLIKLCILYQVEPNDLLNFFWKDCEEILEPGVIYRWELNVKLNTNKLLWICPVCKHKNIDYNVAIKKAHHEYYQFDLCTELQCENEKCSSVFNEVHN